MFQKSEMAWIIYMRTLDDEQESDRICLLFSIQTEVNFYPSIFIFFFHQKEKVYF